MELRGYIKPPSKDLSNKKYNLTFEIENLSMAEYERLKDKLVDIKISKHREKRSLDANSYCWVLINKLSEKLNIPAVEIYREYIKDLNVCKQMTLNKSEFETLKTAWEMLGIGWQVQQLDITDKDEVMANFYYGSSTYNTKKMAKLIDNIVEDCKLQDIETKTPAELEQMCEEWGK